MAGNEVNIIARLQDNGVTSGVKRIKVALGELKGEDGKLNWAGLAKGGDAAKALSGGLSAAGGALTAGVTVPLVAAGGAAVATATKFDDAMAQVSGALGDPAADMEGLRKLALQLGSDTVFSATEAGNAMVELAKGGMTEADIKGGALAASMDLAAAGQLGLADAAAVTVQMMGSFGLGAGDAARIADALAGAANASSADVSDLTQAMSQCSAQASLAGWSLEDTAAALALFADNGVQGSDAGTSLKTMLQRLAAPTDEAAEAMAAYGIEARDANGHMKSVTGIAAELQGKLGSLSEAERDMALQTIFGSDASRAAAIMMKNGADGLAKYTNATHDATAAEEMASAQKGDLSWALENMQGSLESAGIAFGTALAPAVQVVAEAVGAAAEAFASLPPGVQTAIAVVAGLAAALGPLLVVAGALVAAFPAMQAGLTALAGALALPAVPIAGLVAAIAGVVAAIVYLWNTNEGFRAAVAEAWSAIWGAVQTVIDQLRPYVEEAWAAISGAVTQAMNVIMPIVSSGFQLIIAVAVPVLQSLIQWVGSSFQIILSTISGVMNGVNQVIQGAWALIQGVFQTALGLISGIVTGDFSQMQAGVQGIMSGIVGIISGAWNAITGVVGGAVNGVVSSVQGGLNTALSVVQGIFSGIQSAIDGAMNGAKDVVSDVIGAIKGFFNFQISWPHIPLPHINYELIEVPLLGKVPNPATLSVDWYRTGAIATGPSVVGIGEAGPEAIVPLSGRHMDPYADAVARRLLELQGGERGRGGTVQNFNFYQPIEAPDDVARAVRLRGRYGLAASL